MEEKDIIQPEQGVSKSTIARTICLVVALVNQVLVMFNILPIELSDSVVYEAVSLGATIITSLVAWWKNNSFTKKAIEADAYKKSLTEK